MSLLELEKQTKCYHCGNNCEEERTTADEKDFCCTGCRSVYFMLKNTGLCDYYNAEETPGIFVEDLEVEKFDYLDNDEVISEVVDFQNDKMISVSFIIPQIHCYSCLWLLELFEKIHDGISKSKVNYLKKELSLSFLKSETSLKEVVIKLASLGYEPRIELKNEAKNKSQYKRLLIQLGVAAFCFGNIMFMYFPDYLPSVDKIDERLYRYFGYISLLLSVILIIVSARDYFFSAFRSLKFKQVNLDVPIVLGITTIFIASTIEIISGMGLGYLDSLSGLVFFLLLGKYFQSKTFEQFNFERDYTSYFPLSTIRLSETKKRTTISVKDLAIGDTILIRNEEIIPSDGILLSKNAQIDYSFVTGESLPEQVLSETPVYAGGKVKGEAVEVFTTHIPSQSYLSKLWDNSSKKEQTEIESLSDQVGKWFTLVVLVLAIISGMYWVWTDVATGIKVFASVLIIACPCALALAIPITYGNALRVLGKRNFFLRNASVVERLSKIDTIVLDKTGTLTHSDKGEVCFSHDLTKEESHAVSSVLSNSIHPLSTKIFQFLRKDSHQEVSDFKEVAGKGVTGRAGGLLIKAGSLEWVTNKTDHKQKSSPQVYLSINGDYKGVFTVKNVYRKGLKSLFNFLRSKYKLEVLSGDHDGEKERLKELSGIEDQFFNQTPFSKKEHIKKLSKKGNQVLMIGDGLNDAGALLQASVGVAVTETSVGFTPASDVIIDAKDLTLLHKYLVFSKVSIYVVYACFAVSILYNLVGLFFAVQGELSPLVSAVLMPISSVSILFLSLGLIVVMEKKVFGS